MASTYPTSVDNLNTTHTGASSQGADHASHHNDLADAVNKIEKHAFGLVYNVKTYGAVGDNVANDSVPIQAAIDAAYANGGGKVFCPKGTYRCNVILKANVSLCGTQHGRPGYGAVAPTILKQASSGAVIDTPVGVTNSIGIYDVEIVGLGAGTAGKGIRLRNVSHGEIKRVSINGFADEGLLLEAGLSDTFEDLILVNCVLNRSRGGFTGAIDIGGTDHWLSRIEATTSGSLEGTVTSANLYCVAIAVKMANGCLTDVIGEISDIGLYVSGSKNRFSNCRGDLNYGHGIYVTGSFNQFSSSLALNNSQDTTNVYDGWQFTSASGLNMTDGCLAISDVAKLHRYGFYDDTQTATQKNQHVAPLSAGASTGQYRASTNSGSSFLFASGTRKTLTVNSATPSVLGYGLFVTANTSATTITNFTDGVEGQTIQVFCNDANTRVQHNGSTIAFYLNTGDKVLRSGVTYTFMKSGGIWTEVADVPLAATADVGDAAKTLQARIDGETQIWNTPLTANRAVTLSTTGAFSGARFRVTRTAAATGASVLNVGTGPLKALALGQWCEVTYNGSAWVLTAFGSL